jgi:peptide/nickel transport system substrate-binding protein
VNNQPKLSRRRFLMLSTGSATAGLLAACGAPPAPPAAAPTAAPGAAVATSAPALAPAAPVATAAPAVAPSTFTEAPMLAERVKAGTLPPVAERLPAQPFVVEVLDEIGQYGGEWAMSMQEDDNVLIVKSLLYDGLVRWNADWTNIVPNLAASWQVENNGAKYTFTLREGVKWSDGKPFTTDDIKFWAEDVRMSEELEGDMPPFMQVSIGGEEEDAKVTIIDPLTFSVEWSQPNGLFLQRLAQPQGLELTHYQAAYAKQWHIAYNPAVEAQAETEGLPSWKELWEAKVAFNLSGINARNQNPELPTLTAWVFTNALGDGQRLNGERNPYYWKVDADGQQLPYIDTVALNLVSDREVILLNALNGEVSLQDRRLNDPKNKPVLADSRDKSGFRFFDTIPAENNTDVITFNMTHKDPAKREMFGNKLFRQALSVAINRQNIIDTVYVSQGQPWQAAPAPTSAFYDAEMASQFTEYNPEQANAWLDELGYAKGADGLRLGPDGKPIEFAIMLDGENDAVKLVINDWAAVGVRAVEAIVERSLFRETARTNDHDAAAWSGVGGVGLDVILAPSFYFPYDRESHFGMPWYLWFNDPSEENAEEPPAAIKAQMEAYRQLMNTADPEQQTELMQQVLQGAKEQFYAIGIALPTNGFGIAKNNVLNVPATMFDAYNWPQPGAARPEQFFIKA